MVNLLSDKFQKGDLVTVVSDPRRRGVITGHKKTRMGGRKVFWQVEALIWPASGGSDYFDWSEHDFPIRVYVPEKSLVKINKRLKNSTKTKRVATMKLENVLKGVVILDGEGSIDLSDSDPVHVGVVIDGSGYVPGAAIAVVQNRHLHKDEALQTAFDVLEEKTMKDTDYIEEPQEEWGNKWHDIMTESWDGWVWTLSPRKAARIISSNKEALKYIDIYS